ncbi:hypothetical protein WR25_04507 isoform D [Diploscapter pachys]|nr:hypothetical protein WR25_04507 isoform D [Diploscapter pachys]
MSSHEAFNLWKIGLHLFKFLIFLPVLDAIPIQLKCESGVIQGDTINPTHHNSLTTYIDSKVANVCSDSDKSNGVNSYIVCDGRCEFCMDKIRELPSTVLIISSKKQPIQNLTALWVQTSEVPNGSCQVLSAEDFSVGTENSSGTATSNNGGSSDSNGESLKNFSKTSVLFVSISFIILMVISLACLVFYYVQRFRYAHAKDRLQRRLFNAARKALTRIPTRMLKSGDAELETDCAVCIDPYQTHDVVRTLPCRHVYHKSCIDPWLLEHRTCPMCKADILKYFGFHYNDGLSSRQEDAIPGERGERGDDIEIPSDSLSPSNSFPTTTDGGSQNEHLQQIIIQSTAIPSKSTPASGNRPITAGNIIIHERPQTSSAGTSTSDDRPQRTHREHHSASAPQTRAGGSREKRGSQGQIVNLVQV